MLLPVVHPGQHPTGHSCNVLGCIPGCRSNSHCTCHNSPAVAFFGGSGRRTRDSESNAPTRILERSLRVPGPFPGYSSDRLRSRLHSFSSFSYNRLRPEHIGCCRGDLADKQMSQSCAGAGCTIAADTDVQNC